MQINEIFSSIDGEGIRTGYLVTFIRSQFCNLTCKYCDTLYSWEAYDKNNNKQYKDMSIDEIVSECEKLGNKRITFTGGEPLIQKDAKELIETLCKKGYEVNVETNGAVSLIPFINQEYPNDNIIWTMDWKSPCSGMRDKMIEENLPFLRKQDVLKFVVANKEDLDDMKEVITNNPLKCHIFVSPVFGKIELPIIVEYLKEHNLQQVRMQLQIHKIIWDQNTRGV